MADVDRTSGFFRTDLEPMEAEARAAYLDRRVAEIVSHAYDHAPAFRYKMQAVGADPGDILDVAGLNRLPITEKAELTKLQKDDLPFGGLCGVGREHLRRIHVSPGPIYEPGEAVVDDDRWAQSFFAAGFRPGDIAQITFNFNMMPFAFMLDEALMQMGCLSVPAGVGQSQIQVETMKDLQVAAFVGTPSYLATIADKAEEMGLDLLKDLNLQVAFVAAEMLPESLRAALEERLGMIIRQSYGTADVGCLSYECYHKGGMHFAQDCLVEVVDPETGLPVGENEPGEVVATVFNKAYPLIRFGTGDLSAYSLETCACGRTAPKLIRIMGRVDQVTKIKGVFVHPSGVQQVAARFPQISAFKLLVTREGHMDVMTFVCGLEDVAIETAELKAGIQAAMKEVLRVSGQVEFKAAEGMDQQGKAIDDQRQWE